jgi:hypothetical protein
MIDEVRRRDPKANRMSGPALAVRPTGTCATENAAQLLNIARKLSVAIFRNPSANASKAG